MFGPRSLVRPLLAAPFVLSGLHTLRSPAAKAEQAADPNLEEIAVPLAERVGLPTDPKSLVTINAGVQLGAGALLALGFFARPAAVALAASLVPSTLIAHRFWESKDTGERTAQITNFAKNGAMLGGLLMAALDTGGRPSVFWSSRRAAGKAATSISDVAQSVADSVGSAYHSLPVVNS